MFLLSASILAVTLWYVLKVAHLLLCFIENNEVSAAFWKTLSFSKYATFQLQPSSVSVCSPLLLNALSLYALSMFVLLSLVLLFCQDESWKILKMLKACSWLARTFGFHYVGVCQDLVYDNILLLVSIKVFNLQLHFRMCAVENHQLCLWWPQLSSLLQTFLATMKKWQQWCLANKLKQGITWHQICAICFHC